jgi:diguanylate cyclase (GGDEF)-like protein
MNKSINQKFEGIKSQGKLPSPNGIALKIIQLANKENTSTQQLAHLISNDPALTARIIKAANLLFQHTGKPITSITDGVNLLGINSVRHLALCISLVDDFRAGPCNGFDYPKFWAHSACRALAAQNIVERMHLGVADEAFVLGMLAQIGRLGFATIDPQSYTAVMTESSTSNNLKQVENAIYGLDHNQITALMLADWGLPEIFQKIALHLEQPELSGFSEGNRDWRLLQLFHFADSLASVCSSSPAERHRQIPRLMLIATRIGINSSVLVEIGNLVTKGMIEWCDLLNIKLPNFPAFDELLISASISAKSKELDTTTIPPLPKFKLRILLVDDDRSIQLLYKKLLEESGHIVTTAKNGLDALKAVNDNQPHIIISDWMMPEMDGIEFCKALRKNPEWNNIYIFIVTAQESTDKLIDAFEAGANDYLTKPINLRVLAFRLRAAQLIIQMREALEVDRLQLRKLADELALSNKCLQELALTDALTDLPNRRNCLQQLEQELAIATREKRSMCCMMVDIDHFKSINDAYGQRSGDEALKMVATSLKMAARKQDVVCRIGGEEFLVICPDTNKQAGFQYAERLRKQVSSQAILILDKTIHLTVSIGLSDNHDSENVDAMVRHADERLHTAKITGRDRTIAE